MYQRHVLGKTGEDIAVQYLEEYGYKIIKRNFYCKMGEIDIIAKKDNTTLFVEVKTRSSDLYGVPVESVTKKKLKSIYNSAKLYVLQNKLENEFMQFDVIEVYYKNTKYIINHIKQVI